MLLHQRPTKVHNGPSPWLCCRYVDLVEHISVHALPTERVSIPYLTPPAEAEPEIGEEAESDEKESKEAKAEVGEKGTEGKAEVGEKGTEGKAEVGEKGTEGKAEGDEKAAPASPLTYELAAQPAVAETSAADATAADTVAADTAETRSVKPTQFDAWIVLGGVQSSGTSPIDGGALGTCRPASKLAIVTHPLSGGQGVHAGADHPRGSNSWLTTHSTPCSLPVPPLCQL